MTDRNGLDAPADRVVVERKQDPEYGDVFIIGDEGGEFARASTVDGALRYVGDLLYGPATLPLGVRELLQRAEDQNAAGAAQRALLRRQEGNAR